MALKKALTIAAIVLGLSAAPAYAAKITHGTWETHSRGFIGINQEVHELEIIVQKGDTPEKITEQVNRSLARKCYESWSGEYKPTTWNDIVSQITGVDISKGPPGEVEKFYLKPGLRLKYIKVGRPGGGGVNFIY